MQRATIISPIVSSVKKTITASYCDESSKGSWNGGNLLIEKVITLLLVATDYE